MTSIASSSRVLLAEVREAPLTVDEALDLVRDPACGGIALFVGTVRDHDHGQDVVGLDYSAHPLATEQLATVCATVADAYPGIRVAAVHRVATLQVGDVAVVVAVSAPHRAQAFDACREVIDTLKHEVPIWKHQTFADGGDEWVGIA